MIFILRIMIFIWAKMFFKSRIKFSNPRIMIFELAK